MHILNKTDVKKKLYWIDSSFSQHLNTFLQNHCFQPNIINVNLDERLIVHFESVLTLFLLSFGRDVFVCTAGISMSSVLPWKWSHFIKGYLVSLVLKYNSSRESIWKIKRYFSIQMLTTKTNHAFKISSKPKTKQVRKKRYEIGS